MGSTASFLQLQYKELTDISNCIFTKLIFSSPGHTARPYLQAFFASRCGRATEF